MLLHHCATHAAQHAKKMRTALTNLSLLSKHLEDTGDRHYPTRPACGERIASHWCYHCWENSDLLPQHNVSFRFRDHVDFVTRALVRYLRLKLLPDTELCLSGLDRDLA